ncbi:MAG TPA: GNAT family N-acetyltransferase [Micromonosporaceae bacterium]
MTGVDQIEIRDAGLVIRPWQAGDADAVWRACQDPDIQRWTNVPRPYLREHAEGFVTTHTERAWAGGGDAPLGVFDANSGELLGAHGLISRSGHVAEIGYWVAPWARGRGVATAATRAVATWCLDVLGVRRLVWRAEVGNHASRLVAERVGFRLEGVMRNAIRRPDGRLADAWLAALLPGQLLAATVPVDPVKAARAHTFGQPQPRLTAITSCGAAIGLRAPGEQDLDAIIAACRDPEAVRWTSVPDPYQPEDAFFFVHEYAPACWLRGDAAVFAVVTAADAYLGSMDLRLTSTHTGDVGFLIAPWARGQGYASAALRALCQWGFDALGLHRIEWRAYVGNEASRRVAERAGFTMEGLARAGCVQRGEDRDAWTGSVLRPPTGSA